MAENRKPPVHRRPFLLAGMYLTVYAALRLTGDIGNQTLQVQVENHSSMTAIVAPDPSIPHWRQQVYRGFFSPCMVAEEEFKSAGGGAGVVQGVGDFVRDILQI